MKSAQQVLVNIGAAVVSGSLGNVSSGLYHEPLKIVWITLYTLYLHMWLNNCFAYSTFANKQLLSDAVYTEHSKENCKSVCVLAAGARHQGMKRVFFGRIYWFKKKIFLKTSINVFTSNQKIRFFFRLQLEETNIRSVSRMLWEDLALSSAKENVIKTTSVRTTYLNKCLTQAK